MAFAQRIITSNSAGDQEFTFNFDYIKEEHIKVFVNFVEKAQGTGSNEFQVITNTTPKKIRLNTALTSNNTRVEIRRISSLSTPLVDFSDGSTLTAADLDTAEKQSLFIDQELDDTLKQGVSIDASTGIPTLTNQRLSNVSDPVNAQDVVTKAYLERSGSITSTQIADGTIVNGDIANATITGAKLVNDTVTATQIAANAITASELANNAVDTNAIADSNVTTPKIADSNVTTPKLANDAVTNAKIADDSIDSEHYVDGSIDTQHIGNSQVTTDKIADSNVTTVKIAPANVTTGKIADDAVTQAKIAADSIGHNQLKTDSVRTANILDGNITTDKIADQDVTSVKIAPSAVITGKLANNAVTTDKITDDSVTNAKINNAKLKTLAGMQSGTASKLADNTALTSDIADLNQLDGMAKQTTISDDDTKFPTSGAVVDFVAAQIAPIGGLEVIANETVFPATQPSSGVVISIADAGGLTVNGSGVASNARTSGNGSDNVTITGFPTSLHSQTLGAGLGLMVSSTGSSNQYTYHKLLAKEADVKQLSDDINDFGQRYRVVNTVSDATGNEEGDLIYAKDQNKLLVYDTSLSPAAFKETQSVGNFFIATLSPAFNGSVIDFTLSNAPTNAQQVLLSIGGVIQKPNEGTGRPSEGFSLNGATLQLPTGSAPASGTDYFVIVMGSTVNLNTPGNNTVTSAILQNQSVITAKIADQAVTLDKLLHGDANSDGKFLRANNGADPTFESVITDLVNDTSPQLGGDLQSNGNNITTGDSSGASDDRITLGASADFMMFHDGSYNWFDAVNNHDTILRAGTAGLYLQGGVVYIGKEGASEYSIKAISDGAVELYFDSVKKFATLADGAVFDGDGVSEIKIADDGDGFLNASGSIIIAKGYFEYSGSVTALYTNNLGQGVIGTKTSQSLLFQINNAVRMTLNQSGHLVPGADSQQDLGLTGTRWRNVYADTLYGDGSNLTGISSVGGATGFTLNDNVKAKFGTDQDMLLYHNDTDGQLANSKGNLILANSTDGQIFIDPKNNERGIVVKPDAEVELYYNNVMQFETRDGGATAPGWLAVGINAQLNGAKGTFANDGTHLSLRSFATGGYDSIIFRSANTTVGKVFFNSGGTQYHTSSDYRRKENVVTLTGAIDRVKTLLPKRFNFITEPSVTRDGFLAHEVTAVPEAILGTKDQVATEKDVEEGKADAVGDPIYQTIDQSSLVPLLTAALKEAIAKIETLETKVTALEAA